MSAEQQRVANMVIAGKSVFFTGCAGMHCMCYRLHPLQFLYAQFIWSALQVSTPQRLPQARASRSC